jgi:hypothetical protein
MRRIRGLIARVRKAFVYEWVYFTGSLRLSDKNVCRGSEESGLWDLHIRVDSLTPGDTCVIHQCKRCGKYFGIE